MSPLGPSPICFAQAAPGSKLEFVSDHIDPTPAKANSFRLQAKSLFHRGMASEFDLPACPQYAMPGQAQSRRHVQSMRHLSGMSRVSCGACHSSVGRDFTLRYLANGGNDRSLDRHIMNTFTARSILRELTITNRPKPQAIKRYLVATPGIQLALMSQSKCRSQSGKA
jgi:hypothetical protein